MTVEISIHNYCDYIEVNSVISQEGLRGMGTKNLVGSIDWQSEVAYLNESTCLTSAGVNLHVRGPELAPQ